MPSPGHAEAERPSVEMPLDETGSDVSHSSNICLLSSQVLVYKGHVGVFLNSVENEGLHLCVLSCVQGLDRAGVKDEGHADG